MKPSTRLSGSVIKMGGRTSGASLRLSTLYLAIASGLLVEAALVSVASGSSASAAAAAASKSGQRGAQVVAGGGRPSSSSSSVSPSPSSVSGVAVNLDKADQLALPSSTTSAQLVPVRRSQSSSSLSAQSSTRNTDLSMGQSNIANAKVHLSPKDMNTAAGHHYHGHGKYYMYTEVPKKGAYKMGFKRGNHKHVIERKEHAHKGHVSSYFKWHDKKGKGSHKFEFKHYDKKGKHHY